MKLGESVAPIAEPIESPHGCYWKWASDGGAQLWLLADEESLIGMTPFFSGEGRVRVRLTARVTREDDTPLEGAFHGWAEPETDIEDSGAYPFVFDVVDADNHGDLTLPATVEAQIAAFAHDASVYPSVAAYEASQSGEPKFASKSFIPAGLFSPGGEKVDTPASVAIFTGHVLAAETKTNELTNATYYWALVETYGGSFDVVIDPELSDVAPVVGGVITGTFWLCGRLVE